VLAIVGEEWGASYLNFGMGDAEMVCKEVAFSGIAWHAIRNILFFYTNLDLLVLWLK